MNTKGKEARFIADVLARSGATPWIVDLSLKSHDADDADLAGVNVAAAAGTSWQTLNERSRQDAAAVMIEGGTKMLLEKFIKGEVSGAIGLGGANGTNLVCSILRALPYLVPKVMISTVAGTAAAGWPDLESRDAELAAATPGCYLEVSEQQRIDLEPWLRARRLAAAPLILIQIGNKRTMRRGLRRLAVNNKYWPNERWAEVLRHVRLQHPEHAIVLLGTGPEYALNQEVAALADIAGLCNAADDLPIPRLVALLARAAGLITVDSGPAHAAAAVGCPLVVLFGKALPSLYRPWGTAGADVKVLCGQIAGEPDMLGIEARSVSAAWSSLKLRETRDGAYGLSGGDARSMS